MSNGPGALAPARDRAPTRNGDADRRGRGSLTITQAVVEKIAGQIVSEVAATYGTTGGFLGLGSHADPNARPKVSVTLYPDAADVSIRAGVGYPTSLRRAADEIRSSVIRRVTELTGISVHRVDVEITFLQLSGGGRRSMSSNATSDPSALRRRLS